MNKEEYTIQQNRLLEDIEDLKKKKIFLEKELDQIRDAYIQENKQFDIGDKIKIEYMHHPYLGYDKGFGEKELTSKLCYVCGYYITQKGDIMPHIMKAKKDGTQSKIADYTPSNIVSITVVEKANDEE